ncbi:MAG: alpha/beta fold hydrolase, partial [Oscillospiraceae bacterium]|nr:alpha/beta fold hydrolase [Oscillospiraceae bacterium]
MIRDFYYPSCGAGSIRARCWEPHSPPCGIVQLVHGIAEHVERYDDFAAFLNAQGYLVVAQDHMGHGKSGGEQLAKGYFYGGWFSAVADTYRLTQDTMLRYPNVPYIIFGHSMGSFIARTILAKYPDSGISGCIICGTGWMPDAVLAMGRSLAAVTAKLCGEDKPSKLLHRVMFGSYNSRVAHPRTACDWLTRDQKVVDAYVADPACGFVASAGLARDMLTGLQYIQKEDTLEKMNRMTPVFFIAGGDDPVGNYGAGVM